MSNYLAFLFQGLDEVEELNESGKILSLTAGYEVKIIKFNWTGTLIEFDVPVAIYSTLDKSRLIRVAIIQDSAIKS